MDPRAASHVLAQIATLLELHGEPTDRVRGFQLAAKAVAGLTPAGMTAMAEAPTKAPTEAAGAVPTAARGAARAATPANAPAMLHPEALEVVRELLHTNSANLLEVLQEETPEGLMEMLRVPGLGPARIRLIHDGLHIETLQELENAATDGRLAALPRFGAKTAERIVFGIASLRESGAQLLYEHGLAEAERLRALFATQPAVLEVAVAGSIRRKCDLVRDVDLVAAVRGLPSVVAAALSHLDGVREVIGGGGPTVTLRLTNGTRVDVTCVRPEQFACALWRATGSDTHVAAVTAHASTLGYSLVSDELRDAHGVPCPLTSEAALYAQLGLAYIEPELREGAGEVLAAQTHTLPVLIDEPALRGALHCHSQYSDGQSSIRDMAQAALARGLQYLGVSDHSQSNTYAGGLSRDAVLQQHEEIDALNAEYEASGQTFRVLKGIEADILPCGRVDYDAGMLDRFDFVIASVHSRYGMNERQMTDRVLKALDDPHVTVLGHPTGRLLLTREPYAINMTEVIAKAGAVGVAVELNADPHRLDINWRLCRVAREHGTLVSIGPDAHSPQGLDHITLGVGIARKGWLSPENVLNTRSAADVLAFARVRREAQRPADALV